jgi:hypothetical protein
MCKEMGVAYVKAIFQHVTRTEKSPKTSVRIASHNVKILT